LYPLFTERNLQFGHLNATGIIMSPTVKDPDVSLNEKIYLEKRPGSNKTGTGSRWRY
jgi:hypothetical protein